jgi:hypothetical protein
MSKFESQLEHVALSILATLLLGVWLAAEANAWQRPATPSPCSVDGACQPQGPWGYAGTKWRPWPGDVVGPPPTPAEEAETREKLKLKPFELPPPEKENQRGPTTSKRPKTTKDLEAGPEAGEDFAPEPALPLPDIGPLEQAQPEGGLEIPRDFDLGPPAGREPAEVAPPHPAIEQPEESAQPQEPEESQDDFDPFSQQDSPRAIPREARRRAPSQDDAPPALPPSLRRVSKAASAAPRAPQRESRYVQSAARVQ